MSQYETNIPRHEWLYQFQNIFAYSLQALCLYILLWRSLAEGKKAGRNELGPFQTSLVSCAEHIMLNMHMKQNKQNH